MKKSADESYFTLMDFKGKWWVVLLIYMKLRFSLDVLFQFDFLLLTCQLLTDFW